MHTVSGKDSKKSADSSSDRVSPSIKEVIQYGAAGADTSSRTRSFVCHSTPHFDSTSREVSYSVPEYHTSELKKCKQLFPIFISFSYLAIHLYIYFVDNDEKNSNFPFKTLAFCAILLYNQLNT